MQRLAICKAIVLFLLSMAAVPAFAVENAEVFAFAEAKYPALFAGNVSADWVNFQGKSYYYRYYSLSRNYLAIDTAGAISILGPYTQGRLVSVGPVSAFLAPVTNWQSQLLPYTLTAHEVSSSCSMDPDSILSGVLTPTSEAGVYTTALVGNVSITLQVPGSTKTTFSFPDGNGVTTENIQLVFDAQTRGITGTSDWTNSNGLGCAGHMTFSGSYGAANQSTIASFDGTYTGNYSSSAVTTAFTATVSNGAVRISIPNGTGGTGVVEGSVSASGLGALVSFTGFDCPPSSGSLQLTLVSGGAVLSGVSYSPLKCNDGPSGTWSATRQRK